MLSIICIINRLSCCYFIDLISPIPIYRNHNYDVYYYIENVRFSYPASSCCLYIRYGEQDIVLMN